MKLSIPYFFVLRRYASVANGNLMVSRVETLFSSAMRQLLGNIENHTYPNLWTWLLHQDGIGVTSMYAPWCSVAGGKSIPKFGLCLSFQPCESIIGSIEIILIYRPTELFDHPRLRDLLRLRPNWQIHTYIGMFGAPTWKPVRLVSSHPAVEGLVRTIIYISWTWTKPAPALYWILNLNIQPACTCRTLDRSKFAKSESTVVYWKNGRKCFKGAGQKLKNTQVYPPAFGRKAFWLQITLFA